jgi:bacterioferritin (cytochrome b1)
MSIKDLIRDLNELLNQEVSTANRNILRLATVVGADGENIRTTYRRLVGLEMRHAQAVADLIVLYCGIPVIDPTFALPPGDIRPSARESLQEMLESDAMEEQNEAGEYLRLARRAGALALTTAKTALTRLAADKTRHAQEIWRLVDSSALRCQAVRLPG